MHLSNALRMLMSSLSVRGPAPCHVCGYYDPRDPTNEGHYDDCTLQDVLMHPDYAAWRAGEVMPEEPPRGERQVR